MNKSRWLRFLLIGVSLAFTSLWLSLLPALAAAPSAEGPAHCGLAAPANPRLELGTVLPGALSGGPVASVPVDCLLVPATGLSSPVTVASLESWLDGGAERIIMALPRTAAIVPAVPGWLDGGAERILLAPPAVVEAAPLLTGYLDAGASRYLWFPAAQSSGGWRDAGAGTR